MKLRAYRSASILVAVLAAWPAAAEETGWLERQPGFVDEVMGARVESVENLQDNQQKILVSVPASVLEDETVIEEVLVTAPHPGDIKVEVEVHETPRYEFVKDYDQDRYGFVIYLGRDRDLPFRIHFMADDSSNMRGLDQ